MMKSKVLLILILFSINVYGQEESYSLPSVDNAGNTFIEGIIRDFGQSDSQNNFIEILVKDWTTGGIRQYFSYLDSSGLFFVRFFVLNPQDVLLIYKNRNKRILVIPNDTLKIEISAEAFPDETMFSGTASETYNDFENYLRFSQSGTRSIDKQALYKLGPVEYKSWRDSVFKSELFQVEEYICMNNPDDFIVEWIRADIYAKSVVDVLDYYFNQGNVIKLDTAFINSIDFDLFGMKMNSIRFRLVNLISVLTSISGNYSFSSWSKREIAQDNIEDKQSKRPRYTSEELQSRVFRIFVRKAGTLQNELLQQSVISAKFFSILERQNIDIGIDSLLLNLNDHMIISSAVSRYYNYKFRNGNLNAIKIMNDGSEFIDSLTIRFEGYVIYFAFWGTWSPSSISQMRIVDEIKDEIKDSKIVFIYLCCKCQKDLWQETKEEYEEDEHIFLTSSQYAYMLSKININTIPHYLIIDKNGRIVNDHAPTPNMRYQLLYELRKYL